MNPTPKPPSKPKPLINRNLSRWFWGTILVLAAASILLTIIAAMRNVTVPPGAEEPDNTELSRTMLENLLVKPNQAALAAAKKQIGPLLDAAYVPVYAAIPAYTDFHYSLTGEYIELTEAALGNLSGAIQKKLFSGLEERLNDVVLKLDKSFGDTFRSRLDEALAKALPDGSAGTPLGPLTQSVVEGTKARIRLTAPVAGAALIGGGASLKVASTLIAKKIGAKIAAKAATKTGGKWVAAATGAGGGAVICSWAGPGAGICAAGGAVIAWVAVDVAVLKLDELWNRKDFEDTIRSFIDEDKTARKEQLERALVGKAIKVQKGTDIAMADFTLKQLSGAETAAVCSSVASLISQYDLYRANLSERSPASILAFRSILAENANDLVLGHLVREIEQKLVANGSRFIVTQIKISGNVALEFREDRDVSGLLSLNEQTVEFERSEASESSGFVLRASPRITLIANSPEKIRLDLEQHRRLFSNRLFWGSVDLDLFDAMPNSKGLAQNLKLMVPIGIDEDAESLLEVDAQLPSARPVTIEMSLFGEQIPELQHALDCAE